MRWLSLLAVVASVSGCGIRPVNAELYTLVVDYFRAPASCYTDGMQPTNGVTAAAPRAIDVQVWDGPEGGAFLEVLGGNVPVDMGDAPTVELSGVFIGTRGSAGWTFTTQQTAVNGVNGLTFTTTTSASVTFWRDATFKGTAALSSSRVCAGAACPGAAPSCSVTGLAFQGTRLAVDWQQAP